MRKTTKGLLLCGGKGTRLRPATLITNKHLIPIVATPMVLYPLHTLKRLRVSDILVITGGEHVGGFAEFLGDGSRFGVKLTYKVQEEAGGIAQAMRLAEDFVGDDSFWVALGDNVFGTAGFPSEKEIEAAGDNAIIVTATVEDNYRFGVPIFNGNVLVDIVEKPENPPNKFAVTGLYRYPAVVFDLTKDLKPSDRGEFEITDVNRVMLEKGLLKVLHTESFWSDCGTPDSLARTTRWFLDNQSQQP